MRLTDTLTEWLARVEVALSGGDADVRDARQALAQGDPARARTAAHRILARVPGAPLGLALLADACEAAELFAEQALALEELAERLPSRAEVWVRLGRARARTDAPPEAIRQALLRALATAPPGSDARKEALLGLADLDAEQPEGAPRAALWLLQLGPSTELAVRWSEVRLRLGDGAGALRALDGVDLDPTDGRGHLALGRALAAQGDAAALTPLLRAAVLESPQAHQALLDALSQVPVDAEGWRRVRALAEAQGLAATGRWRAALARAEGRPQQALGALREATLAGEDGAAEALLRAAVEAQDEAACRDALAALDRTETRSSLAEACRRLPSQSLVTSPDHAGRALDALRSVTEPALEPWAAALAAAACRTWVPKAAPARWDALLERLTHHARALSDLASVTRAAAIATERARPVRLAVVGEFNAGKSTFLNALVGADVAPTGVLPTTATLHHLRYGPEPLARIVLGGPEACERLVALENLKATLTTAGSVDRVELHLPVAFLTRIEVLDTPGFNAPDTAHRQTAERALEEADVLLWLMDASQALKKSEAQVLERAQAEGVPVQVLLNKVDRLSEGQAAEVVSIVTQSLASVGLSTLRPPIAFSARLALAGRLGDPQALARSGWTAVQAMLDDAVVGQAEALKEQSLRRRARSVLASLIPQVAQSLDAQQASRRTHEQQAESLLGARLRLAASTTQAIAHVSQSVHAEVRAWRDELAPLVETSGKLAGPALAHGAERAATLLAPAFEKALRTLVDLPSAPCPPPGTLRAIARTFCCSVTADTCADALQTAALAAVTALAEVLDDAANAPPPEPTEQPRLRELKALHHALSPR